VSTTVISMIAVAVLIVVTAVLFTLALCSISAKADRISDEMYRRYYNENPQQPLYDNTTTTTQGADPDE